MLQVLAVIEYGLEYLSISGRMGNKMADTKGTACHVNYSKAVLSVAMKLACHETCHEASAGINDRQFHAEII